MLHKAAFLLLLPPQIIDPEKAAAKCFSVG
jgi:hypothetical protein